MLTPFESLSDHARLWIYQSNRKFNSEQLITISDALTTFTSQWSAHGVPLRASFTILYDQFIVLAVDEQSYGASGCSIDDSTRTMQSLGEIIGVDLFDRTKAAFHTDERIVTIALSELRQRFEEGTWNRESLLVNVLVKNKGELTNGLLVPANRTWLKRYLPHEKVAG